MCLRPSANEGGILAPAIPRGSAPAQDAGIGVALERGSTGQPLSRATTGWIPLPTVPIAVFPLHKHRIAFADRPRSCKV
jgi:hypothetical protein